MCVLINIIYFKGDWKEAFDKSLTSKGPFKAIEGEKQVDFMHHYKLMCGYLESYGAVYLAIPYRGGRVNFVIEMREDGMIRDSEYTQVLSVANQHQVKYDVRISNFKVSFRSNLNKIMNTLGVRSIYKPSNDSIR